MDRRAPRETTPIVVNCRHCLHHQALYAARMDLEPRKAWYRCRSCENWFVIRWDDAVALGLAASADELTRSANA
jgi:hypothetical protein